MGQGNLATRNQPVGPLPPRKRRQGILELLSKGKRQKKQEFRGLSPEEGRRNKGIRRRIKERRRF